MHSDPKRFSRGITCVALAGFMLTSGLGGIGEFRCNMGMAEAGPECPMCHGSEISVGTSNISQPCCEFVEELPPPPVVLTAKEELPAPSAGSFLPSLRHVTPILQSAPIHEVVARDVGPPAQNQPLFLRP
jgi:hypothetical protein